MFLPSSLYVKEGSCNNCGECCKIVDFRMRVNNSKTGFCKHAYQKDDKWHCQVRDNIVKLNTLPKFEKDYYNNECLTFPDEEDDKHWGLSKTSSCSYTRRES